MVACVYGGRDPFLTGRGFMKILLSAYACEPKKGSEPGVGWNIAAELARSHEVLVLTRRNNREAIEEELARRPMPGLAFVYHDLPGWASWWKRGGRGVQLYYYLWQLTARKIVQSITARGEVDVCHHVTFAKYWGPSALVDSTVPYAMGPLGGADSVPRGLERALGLDGWAYEVLRVTVRRVAELDPAVRRTVRRSAACVGATQATSTRLHALGARRVETWNQVGVEPVDPAVAGFSARSGFRVACVGRLVPLKAVGMAVEAVARCRQGVTLEIIGDGPSRAQLERLCTALGATDRVRFLGDMPRERALEHIRHCDVLMHPSLHDSGGMVCAEALACGRPVIALDWAGPADLVTRECGVLVDPRGGVDAVVNALRDAVMMLADDQETAKKMGEAGRLRARELLSWEQRANLLSSLLQEIAGESQ